MKRNGTLVAVLVVALLMGGFIAFAKPGSGGTPTIVSVLNEILAELQVISGQLASGGMGGEHHAGIAMPAVADGLVAPPAMGENVLVSINGPGRFLSARVSKQGGLSGLTEVRLQVDGQDVVRRNFVALQNLALTEQNPYGVAVLSSGAGIDTATIGFTEPLIFESNLTLSANVGESGIVQITGAVVYGR